ncbi:MAG: hypothetical protein FWG74_07550 [Planctomycetes bacterium]|nr:hypothetical protein [Planctomycetota bacterium]
MRPRPVRQPLLAIRTAQLESVEDILSSRQARMLNLSATDFSGRLPGLDVRMESLRGFLAALGRAGAKNFWYCLMQRGESLINQAGTLGFELPAKAEDFSADALPGWLSERGLEVDGLAFEIALLDGGGWRLAVGGDRLALQEALSGESGERTVQESWRKDFELFMAGEPAGVGLWLNPRPLLGLLFLLGGPDIRRHAATAGLAIPDSLSLRALPDGDGIGFAAHFNNLLPVPLAEDGNARLAIIPRTESAAGEMTLAVPGSFLLTFLPDSIPFAILNLDATTLVPRLVRLLWWLEPGGGLDWQAAVLMGGARETRQSLGRVMAWLDVLAETPSADLAVSRLELPGGERTWRFEWSGGTLILGAAEVGGNMFLLVSEKEERYPDFGHLSLSQDLPPRLLSWDLRLDDTARRDAAADLAAFLGARVPGGLLPDAAYSVLDSDWGLVRVEGRTVTLETRRTTTALALPFLAKTFAGEAAKRRDNPTRLVKERLLFLLGVANQSRFRQTNPKNFLPGTWPRSLAELAFVDDPAGLAWLERSFPRFPGRGGHSTAEAVRHIASGRPAGGYRFAIVDDSEGWRLEANGQDGRRFSINNEGKMLVYGERHEIMKMEDEGHLIPRLFPYSGQSAPYQVPATLSHCLP